MFEFSLKILKFFLFDFLSKYIFLETRHNNIHMFNFNGTRDGTYEFIKMTSDDLG